MQVALGSTHGKCMILRHRLAAISSCDVRTYQEEGRVYVKVDIFVYYAHASWLNNQGQHKQKSFDGFVSIRDAWAESDYIDYIINALKAEVASEELWRCTPAKCGLEEEGE